MTKEKRFRFSKNVSTSLKPFLNINQLIHRIEVSDGLCISFSEEEKINAKVILKTTNYYSISIYKKQLPYAENQTFSFTELVQLVNFDVFLRNSIFPFTLRIEDMLKTTLVTAACVNYTGPYHKGECYLDKRLYRSDKVYDEVMGVFESTVEENRSSLVIQHHIKEKDSRFPFWALAQEMTFGQFSFVLKHFNKDIRETWSNYGFLSNNPSLKKIKGQEISSKLSSWFSAAWFLRNLCAHNQRLYGRTLISGNPKLYSVDLLQMRKFGKKKQHNRDLFGFLISIKNIIIFDSITTQTEWNNFLCILEKRIQADKKVVSLPKIGFVEEWKSLLYIDIEKGTDQLL